MKKLWVAIQVLLVIVSILGMAGGVVYLVWQKGIVDFPTVEDFFSEGRNQKCVFRTQTSGGGTAQAEIFTWGMKVYAHYSGENKEGVKNESFMIVGDKYIYAWTDEEFPGVIMPADGKQAKMIQPLDGEELVCRGWKADKKLFEPPANIKFVDYRQMQDPKCGPCEYLLGEQRDSCREAARCK